MRGGKADAGLILAVKIDAGEFKFSPGVARAPFNTGEQLATAAFPLFKIAFGKAVAAKQPPAVGYRRAVDRRLKTEVVGTAHRVVGMQPFADAQAQLGEMMDFAGFGQALGIQIPWRAGDNVVGQQIHLPPLLQIESDPGLLALQLQAGGLQGFRRFQLAFGSPRQPSVLQHGGIVDLQPLVAGGRRRQALHAGFGLRQGVGGGKIVHVKRLRGEPVVVRLGRRRAVEMTDVGRIPGEAGDIPLRCRILTCVQQGVEKLMFFILLARQPRGMLMNERQRRLNLLKGDIRGDDPADGPVGNHLLLREQALVFADDLRVVCVGVQRAQTVNARPGDVRGGLRVGTPGGDHRVVLRQRRAGQRVTRIFFTGRRIGKAHQLGGGVQLQVALFRGRQFDAIREAEGG